LNKRTEKELQTKMDPSQAIQQLGQRELL